MCRLIATIQNRNGGAASRKMERHGGPEDTTADHGNAWC